MNSQASTSQSSHQTQLSQSRPSSQQPSQSKQPSQQDLQDIINDTVVFILSQDHNKHSIKRQDIVKNCFRNFSRAYKAVMDEVKVILEKVFGMELVEIEHGSNNKYFLKQCNADYTEDLEWSEDDQALQTLLMLVLSHIFMCGGVAREDTMWKFLEHLGISKTRTHDYFGDVRKLMTQEFVRQSYVDYIRIPDSVPPKYEYRWGQRAEQEIHHREILEFVSEVHGINDIAQWPIQYKMVEMAENKRDGKVKKSASADDSD